MKIKTLSFALAGLCLGYGSMTLAADGNSAKNNPESIVHTLMREYRSTPKDCGGSPLRPAFMCSGLMIRGTMPSDQYHSWNPSPNSIKSGGTSFSYMRADIKFGKLAYGYKSGFILYPQSKTPKSMTTLRVLCMFPIDGDTDRRNNAGCGTHQFFPKDSKECGKQGITRSNSWLSHYTRTRGNRRQHTCAFDLYQRATSAEMFAQSLISQIRLGNEGFATQNELRISTWAQDIGPILPIQAFFYVEGGLDGARHDQIDFYNDTGRIVPIVKMILPKDRSQQAQFTYAGNDQAVNTANH